MKSIIRLLVLLALAYIGAAAWLYIQQDSMIFLPQIPTRDIVSTPADIRLGYDDLKLLTIDQETLHAWFIPNEKSQIAILVCHGNAGNISHRLDTLRRFHDLGLNVLLFDYRGFGQSTGVPGEQGTYLDAQAAWGYLIDKGFSAEQIVIFGRSLGGGVATELASQQHAAAVILESTFTSIPDRGAELYPWLPVKLLARTHYNNLGKVSRIKSPLLVLHSESDELIPFHHGQQLFQVANEPKELYKLNGDHNNGWRMQNGYNQVIASFLKKHLLPRWYP